MDAEWQPVYRRQQDFGLSYAVLDHKQCSNIGCGPYYCRITGSCGIRNSAAANMTVQNKTLINSQPTNQEACPGTNVTFKVITTGTNLQYQWQSEGVDIPGENDPTLVLSPVSVADEGLYRCVVTGDCGIVFQILHL